MANKLTVKYCKACKSNVKCDPKNTNLPWLYKQIIFIQLDVYLQGQNISLRKREAKLLSIVQILCTQDWKTEEVNLPLAGAVCKEKHH